MRYPEQCEPLILGANEFTVYQVSRALSAVGRKNKGLAELSRGLTLDEQ